MDLFRAYIRAGQLPVSNFLLEHYVKLGLTTEEMMLWLQLAAKKEQGETFPDLQPVAEAMGITQERIFHLLNQLVEKQVLAITSTLNEEGRRSDAYDLQKIYEKLEQLLTAQQQVADKDQQAVLEKNLYQNFEQEFGRPLSPMEYQRIAQWLEEDSYPPELIQLALREAVLNQAYSLNYVDRILLSWERKNIKTKEQVQKEQQRRKEMLLQKETPAPKQALPKVSLHNWLEGEKNP